MWRNLYICHRSIFVRSSARVLHSNYEYSYPVTSHDSFACPISANNDTCFVFFHIDGPSALARTHVCALLGESPPPSVTYHLSYHRLIIQVVMANHSTYSLDKRLFDHTEKFSFFFFKKWMKVNLPLHVKCQLIRSSLFVNHAFLYALF